MRELSRDAHAVTLALLREANAVGAQDVLAWQTGYPPPSSFAAGHPVADPDELSAWRCSRAGTPTPRSWSAATLDGPGGDPGRQRRPAPDGHRGRARVAFAPAAAGVHRPGVVHRLDGVPVPLRAPLRRERPGDASCSRRSSRRSALMLRIAGGRVYDPANGVAGEVRDVCLDGGTRRRRRCPRTRRGSTRAGWS